MKSNSFYTFVFTAIFALFIYNGYCRVQSSLPGDDLKIKTQTKSRDTLVSTFKFGVNFLSSDVFMGRTDTVTTPVVSPNVKYTLKSGIYFSGALNYIPNKKKKRLDGGDIAVGYDFNITDDLSGGASFTKLFYSSNSTQIGSSISSTFNFNLSYDIGTLISPTLSADYNRNSRGISNDLVLNFGLTHDFIIIGVLGQKDIILISPTAAVNAGTENFYDAYLTKKKFKNITRTAEQNTLITTYIARLGQFGLLDYELSAPVEYKAGHFIFQFIPTYAIVKNQIPKQIAARLSNDPSVFYFETGIALKF